MNVAGDVGTWLARHSAPRRRLISVSVRIKEDPWARKCYKIFAVASKVRRRLERADGQGEHSSIVGPKNVETMGHVPLVINGGIVTSGDNIIGSSQSRCSFTFSITSPDGDTEISSLSIVNEVSSSVPAYCKPRIHIFRERAELQPKTPRLILGKRARMSPE